ncbi:MAG: dihydrolipoyl dehydrogenase [Thermoplasmata archaeon]|nr:dihydrolipoyl dehydrogenase [Thermoplasmata archaeon]
MPDTVVLGSGSGGYVAAIRCSQMGQSVAIVEMGDIGGVCTNTGCIPTKTLLESAKLAREIRKSSRHGISVSDMSIDFSKVMKRKDSVVSRSSKGVEFLLKENNVEMINGKGFIVDKNTVRVEEAGGSRELQTKYIIIATGSKERELPNLKMDGEKVLGSDHLLDIEQLPSSLLIVGGGAIGVEFAQIFSSLGTKVTIVELMGEILPMEDRSVGEVLAKVLRKQSVDIHTGSKVEGLEVTDSGVIAKVTGDSNLEIEAEKVLLSVGRVAWIDEEVIGPDIDHDNRGIKVNEKMQTSVPNIYAIGDVTGKVMLAHVASQQAEIAANNICGFEDEMDYSLIPSCIYTSPEVGSFGLGPEEAGEIHGEVSVGEFPLVKSGRARTSGETEGFARIVSNVETGGILGAQIVAPRATDMVQLLLLAKERDIPISDIARIIYPHPTFIEVIREAALEMRKREKCAPNSQQPEE